MDHRDRIAHFGNGTFPQDTVIDRNAMKAYVPLEVYEELNTETGKTERTLAGYEDAEGAEIEEGAKLLAMLAPMPAQRGRDDDDSDEEPALYLALRCKAVVCSTCNGRGKHVNPSIDAHGISSEEFDEDPDFREEYMSGTYDVSCYECDGATTVLEPITDASVNDEIALRWLKNWQREERSDRREREAEMRYGY